MDWVRLGMMVEAYGDLGTIVGMNGSANLDVVFVNQLKMGKHKHNCHPWCETRYFDAEGRVIRDYTEKAKGARAAQLDGGQEAALTRCAAGRDGECGHKACPQLRDNEPAKSGRHCPLDQLGSELNG